LFDIAFSDIAVAKEIYDAVFDVEMSRQEMRGMSMALQREIDLESTPFKRITGAIYM